MVFTDNERGKERTTTANSSSYVSLNGRSASTGVRSRSESLCSRTESSRSRTESMSSQRSAASSSSRFNSLYTEDMMLDDIDVNSEYSSYPNSQDVFSESSQDWVSCTSSLSVNTDIDASLQDKVSSPQDSLIKTTSESVEPDQSDGEWITVGRRKKPQSSISADVNKEVKGEL